PCLVLQQVAVLLGQFVQLVLVQDGEAHHMPADLDVADLLDLQDPARGHPRPRAERVEPEVGRGLAVRGGVLGHLAPQKGRLLLSDRTPPGGPSFPGAARMSSGTAAPHTGYRSPETRARINGFEHDTCRASRRGARAR